MSVPASTQLSAATNHEFLLCWEIPHQDPLTCAERGETSADSKPNMNTALDIYIFMRNTVLEKNLPTGTSAQSRNPTSDLQTLETEEKFSLRVVM